MRTKTKLTYDDYAALPNDGWRYELLAGELYMNPAPSPMHQRVSKRLQRQLEAFFEENRLGEVFNAPVDVIFGQHDVAEPDIVVVSDPSQISRRGLEGVPALVVEVLSPSTRAYDRTIKLRRYLELGVRSYWILDPEARHLICQHPQGDRYVVVAEGRDRDRVTDPAWPELAIDLADLWRESPSSSG